MSTTLLSLSTSQLKQALAIREKIEALERELEQVVAGASPVTNGTGDKRKWTMSPGARAKIAAAQRARWAKQKTGAPAGKPAKGKRKMSAAARAKIAAVARARWAKAKAAGRSAL